MSHQPSRPISRPIWRALPTAFALLVIATASQAATAQNVFEAQTARYRCTVLSDSESCPASAPEPSVRLQDRLDPGPLAQHLIHLGASKEAAIEQASAGGEQPTRRLLRITLNSLTSEERYKKAAGTADPSAETVETLYSAAVTDEEPPRRAGMQAGARLSR